METKSFRRGGVFTAIVAAVAFLGMSAPAMADNSALDLEFNFAWVEGQNITQFNPVTLFYKVGDTTVKFNYPLIVDSSVTTGLGNTDSNLSLIHI